MIGILGGTFDPIHNGHLRTALDVQQALNLEQILLIPLRDPPHREHPSLTATQRLALLKTAAAGEPRLAVDTRELDREGKSYTVDTLQSLRQERPDTTLCLLLGSDAFQQFHRWHQPERILKLAHLVVMQRPGEALPDEATTVSSRDRITRSPEALREQPAGLILPLSVTQLQISSTRIRQMLARGQSPRYLLPDPVLKQIEQNGYYQDSPPSSNKPRR